MFVHLDCNKLATYWLKNGIFALAVSSIYLILIIFFLLYPGSSVFLSTDIRSALVIHVNLSILVWFVSNIAAVWCYKLQLSYFTITCVILAFIATVLIALSLICGPNFSVMNKYIPMLENILFVLGFSLLGVTILLLAFYTLYHTIFYFQVSDNSSRLIKSTILSTSILFILMWVCFTLSYLQLKTVIKLTEVTLEFYYELLFWSGSCLLQFIYTQTLIFVWIILFYSGVGREVRYNKLYLTLLALNFVIALAVPMGHLLYNILDEGFKEYYIVLERYGNGIIPVLVLVLLLYDLMIYSAKTKPVKKNKVRAVASFSLICSGILFVLGRLVELSITNTDLLTLAYYQAPVAGITIAFIGFSFLIICRY